MTDSGVDPSESSDDDIDELVELAVDRGDLAELRRLADEGSSDAAEQLQELAAG